jgi:hypothetical protein
MTPLERQSRACQHVWRLHLHGPEAAERTGRTSITRVPLLPVSRFGAGRSPGSRRMTKAVNIVHEVVTRFA